MNGSQFLRRALLVVIGVMGMMSVYAQQVAVKGVVRDAADNSPIPGVSVVVKSTTKGTITEFDGNFSLSVNQGDVLVFSFIGYATQELTASASMNVSLAADAQELDDVVVIGYGVAKKNDMTGSVTAIKPDEMTKGITTSAQDMMVGKIAGVNVTTNGGTPGGGATIRVRGGSSLSASNDPLIVIDGLAMDNNGVQGLSNGLSMVNPDDIETLTVLKDASATAIYGSRASNGVIIITTKKGKVGKPQIAYSGNVSVATPRKLYEVLDGNEYRELVQSTGNESAIALLGDANTDWQDEIYRLALSTDHNVSISGATSFMPYRFSVGYTCENGIVETSKFQRFTAALNVAPKFLEEHLGVNLNAKYMYAKNRYADGGVFGAAIEMDPTQPVKADGYETTGGYWQSLVSTTDFGADWTTTTNTNTPQNPVALLNLKDDEAKAHSFIGNLEVDYKLHGLEDLRIHANIGGDYSEGRQETVISPYAYSNNFYGYEGISQSYKYNLQGTAYLQYAHEFENQNLDVMAGAEEQHFHRVTFSEGQGWNPLTEEAYSPSLRSETKHIYRNSLVSYFGRLNYTLLDRYLLTFTVRWDGSSRFAEDNQWGTFPSAAFGWKIKEESFLKDSEVVSDLKLRLGWGKTGQQDIGYDFYYSPRYVVSDQYAQYTLGQETYYTSRPEVYNDKLQWETTTTYNVGLDYSFLNGRISGALDYYYRETEDLISTVSVASGTNFGNYVTKNIGSLSNTGVEFSIDARPVVNNNFTWQVTYNTGWNKNKIEELADGVDFFLTGSSISAGLSNQVQANKVGEASNAFYVYQQVYDASGKPLEGVYVDRNGDGTINADDKYIYKKPTADVTMGMTNKFLIKNFDFSFTLRASLNNYLYYDFLSNKANTSDSGLLGNGALHNTTKEALDLGFQGKTDYYMSDYFIRNASFLRCDNITLGYSFNKLFSTGSYKGVNGRVYATVQNPFVITKYDGLDPEISSGVDSGVYPRPTTYLIGLSLNF